MQGLPWGDEVLLKHNRVDKEPASNLRSETRKPKCCSQLFQQFYEWKTKKTRWNRRVNGPNSHSDSNNLVGLCFQAYLSVHSSENGQPATHFTRQKRHLCGKQWTTNPETEKTFKSTCPAGCNCFLKIKGGVNVYRSVCSCFFCRRLTDRLLRLVRYERLTSATAFQNKRMLTLYKIT